jgi:hypothetical protein
VTRAPRGPRAAGARVGGGRLRVDAARAVHKLREHQLADPAMWALEAVRAAAAVSASAVHVDGDIDDVWVAWEGEPIARAELPRLLGELVTPHAAEERRAIRLLATAVNTALGLGPRWVDVYSIDEPADEGTHAVDDAIDDDGAPIPSRTAKVRYTPRLLTTGDDGTAAGLRSLAAIDATLPVGAPAIERGVVVHLRRFPSLEALTLLVTGREPRELRLVRRACEDFALPLRIARGPLAIHHASTDLLRLQLDVGALARAGRSAFLAIVDPSTARSEPSVDYAELGVVLATQPLATDLSIPFLARVPIRLRIDAPRMPTNASRAAVRRDECIAEIEAIAVAAIPELLARLARELGDAPEAAWSPERRERLRAAAIQLACTVASGPDWRGVALARTAAASPPDPFAPLFQVAIAHDAIGRPRSIADLARSGITEVHGGRAPLPASLAPWLGDVPWVPPGDPIARLWGPTPPRPAKGLVARAEAAREARERWLAKPVAPPRVERTAEHVLVVPLAAPGRSTRSCVPERVFARPDLVGEVAISLAAPIARIDLSIEGRITEQVRTSSLLAIDAAATASDLRLAPDHGSIVPDQARESVMLAIDGGAVVGCEAIARALCGDDPPPGETAEWLVTTVERDALAVIVRRGIALAAQLIERLGAILEQALLDSKSPLLDAPVWPTVRGAMRSLRELLDVARRPTDALGLALSTFSRAHASPEDRPVALVDAAERDLLTLLASRAGGSVLDYTGRLEAPYSADSIAQRLGGHPLATLTFDHGVTRGAIGWTRGPDELVVSHVGVPLVSGLATPSTGHPSTIHIDDDRIVPTAQWTGVRWVPKDLATLPRQLEAGLAIAVADALLGRPPPTLLRAGLARPSALLPTFLSAAARLSPSPREVLGPTRIAELRAAAIYPRAFGASDASIDDLIGADGAIGFLPRGAPALSGPPPGDLAPLTLDTDAVDGLAKLFALRVRNVTGEIELRLRARERERRLASHRNKPERALALPGCAITTRVSGTGITGLVGLDRRAADYTEVVVLCERRPLTTLTEPLPHLRAIVDVDPSLVDDQLEDLLEQGSGRIRGALRESICKLVVEVARSTRGPIEHDERAERLLDAWLAAQTGKRRAAARAAIEEIAALPIFSTIQGGVASIVDARRGGKSPRVAEPIDRWVEPAAGEPRSPFDDPVLTVSDDPDHPVRALIRGLAGDAWRNVSADVRRLQAARRIAHGLARRPSLDAVADRRFRYSLEELAEVAPSSERSAFQALGIGEVALSHAGPTRLVIFEAGVRIAAFEWDLRPAVSIACEPASIRARGGAISAKERSRLESAVRVVIARLMRHLVDTTPPFEIPDWVKLALRASALLGGLEHLELLAELPMFQATSRAWVSARDLQIEAAARGSVWYTRDPSSSALPLDPDRIALRLSAAEAQRLAALCPVHDADEDLRLDQIARANRARPRVSLLGPSGAELERAVARAVIPRDEAIGRHGIVLALRPDHAAARAIHCHRDGQPLGTIRPALGWPLEAWLDDPRFVPDRTWSAPVDDEVLDQAKGAIRDACERALDALFVLPGATIEAIRIDRAVSEATLLARDIHARGVLAIELGAEPTLQVLDASGLVSCRPPGGLPLTGRLMLAGIGTAAGSGPLLSLCRGAYLRMVRAIALRLASRQSVPEMRDVELAEVVRAATLGVVEENGHASALRLSCFDPPDGPATITGLLSSLARRDRVLVLQPEERARASASGWRAPTVVDDGTLTARRVILAFGDRAVTPASADLLVGSSPPIDAPARVPAIPASAAATSASTTSPTTTSTRRASSTPPSSPTRVIPPPIAVSAHGARTAHLADRRPGRALAARLDALIESRGALAGRLHIAVDPLSSGALATLRDGGAVELAARHALIRRLDDTDADPPEEALAILAAHLIGLAVAAQSDREDAELRAIHALLGD